MTCSAQSLLQPRSSALIAEARPISLPRHQRMVSGMSVTSPRTVAVIVVIAGTWCSNNTGPAWPVPADRWLVLGEEFLLLAGEEQVHFCRELTVSFQRGIGVDDLERGLACSLDELLVAAQ